jgi:hypothetical protein
MRAVYKDAANRTYSCPVEKRDDKWVMLTSDGPAEITYNFQDDEAGPLVFSHYRDGTESEDSRLHLPERIGTESSFQQLQRANVARINAERKHREQARAEAQDTFVNPAKIAEARSINAEFAALRNRHAIKNQ